jgi:hypothetical protein
LAFYLAAKGDAGACADNLHGAGRAFCEAVVSGDCDGRFDQLFGDYGRFELRLCGQITDPWLRENCAAGKDYPRLYRSDIEDLPS